MHRAIFEEFDRICRMHGINGDVLEVGATPDASTLLNLPALKNAKKKIGINQAGASNFADFAIVEGNANAMTCFADESFDAVLCNAVLEHDPFFWRTLTEIRRVARKGALIAIGTPGYGVVRFEKTWRRWFAKIPRPFRPRLGWALQHSTLTLGVHNFPGDYYRFTEQTYREVFFAGMKNVDVRSLLNPPRVVGSGVRE